MKETLTIAVTVALLAGSMGVNAALIGSYGTGSTGSASGGSFTSDLAIFDVNHGAYFQGATTPASNWVWGSDPSGFATINFTFSFNLTGYDISTASLSGLWGVDNTGSVSLNGYLLSSLPNVIVGNFKTLTGFSTAQQSLFNQGVNSLVYTASNAGGPGAFRAAGKVSADLATATAVPLPTALMLVALGLAGLGLRKKPKA